LKFSINLPRSSWNTLTDRPKEFRLYLEVESFDKRTIISFPLHRVTKLPFPSYYGPFFLDQLSWTEKSDLMRSFTDMQVLEIDKYRDSLKWHYDSEESLIKILDEVKEQLVNVALPTIDFANTFKPEELEAKNLDLEMRKKASELYLMQLELTSRFPTE